MKPRSPAFALLALVLLAWNASAQGRADTRRDPHSQHKKHEVAQTFGAFERTKLLSKGRGSLGGKTMLHLGSAQRRSLLTTGKLLAVRPKPQRRHHR